MDHSRAQRWSVIIPNSARGEFNSWFKFCAFSMLGPFLCIYFILAGGGMPLDEQKLRRQRKWGPKGVYRWALRRPSPLPPPPRTSTPTQNAMSVDAWAFEEFWDCF